MAQDYWIKQSSNKPAFPELLWSRPENKQHAGKILIVGGNAHSFSAPAEAFQKVTEAGAGVVRVILPDAIQKLIKGILPDANFAPSTPSGSFAVRSLDEILASSNWADVLLLAGDLGRNSETAILIEKLVEKTSLPIVATKDSADYLINLPKTILERESVCLVLTIAELQKLAINLRYTKAVKFEMGVLDLVEFLHEFTDKNSLNIVVHHQAHFFVGSQGKVSTTKTDTDNDFWRIPTASTASVWIAQNPSKIFEALTISVYSEK